MATHPSASQRSSKMTSDSKTTRQITVQPTLYIGLGGIGCAVLRRLKTRVKEIVPGGVSAFAFLGMDTQAHEITDALTANEYVALSINVKPDTVAKMKPEVLDWYRRIVRGWRAKSITAGAHQVKAVGRLALRYPPTFQEFVSKLAKAKEKLGKASQAFEHGALSKVYIISSVMGGTGAGCLVDVMAVVGDYFTREAGPNFPYQAILVTPDVLLGEVPGGQLEVLKSNAYATMKELHNFLASESDVIVDYDNKTFRGLKITSDILPHVIHVIGDKNEKGTIIASLIEEIGDIVVSYLISEIQTPMRDQFANVKVQDQENTYFASAGEDDMPRAFSSFGVVRTGFPRDVVDQLFALRLAHTTLEHELCPPEGTLDQVNNWIVSHGLMERGADQLQDQIKKEHKKIELDAKGNLLDAGFKYEKLVTESKAFQKRMSDALEGEKRKAIGAKVHGISETVVTTLQATCEAALRESSLSGAMEFLRITEESLKEHQAALREEAAQAREVLAKATKEVDSSVSFLDHAVRGLFGRRRRVEDAINDFNVRLENMLNKQVTVWIMEEADKVYAKLLVSCSGMMRQWKGFIDLLKGYKADMELNITRLNSQLNQLADIEKRGPENRFSLVDSVRAKELYDDIVAPEIRAATRRIRGKLIGKEPSTRAERTFADWYADMHTYIIEEELKSKMETLDFVSILDRFYPDEQSRKELFKCLDSLSTPLFRLDENLKQSDYDSYWIVGVNNSLQGRFHADYDRFLGGQTGSIYADFDSTQEIMLYQIRSGYTVHSFLPIREYQSQYEIKQEEYHRGIEKKTPHRPVHCWVEAAEWAEVIPNREEEEAFKWFVLGRAFSHLYPSAGAASPSDRKNTAYLYVRGTNYFVQVSEDKKPEEVGKGLEKAVRMFSERSDLQRVMQEMIRGKVAEVGEAVVRERLEQEYIPILKNEIETATNNPRPGYSTRADILRKLLGAVREYIDEDLKQTRV